MSWLLAILAKPFVLAAYLCVNASAVVSIRRWMPDGWLKRLLLKKV